MIESSLVIGKYEKEDVPEVYFFVDDQLDWYEIELEVKNSSLEDRFKQELLPLLKECSNSEFPFHLYENIVFTKHGVQLLSIETQKTNQLRVYLNIEEYASKKKMAGTIVTLLTIFSFMFGLSFLFLNSSW